MQCFFHEQLIPVFFLGSDQHPLLSNVPFSVNRLPNNVASLFMTGSAFCSQMFEALFRSNAPGPVQKTESEKTCTIAMSTLPIGSSNERLCVHPPSAKQSPGKNSSTRKNSVSVLLNFEKTSSQDSQYVLRMQQICHVITFFQRGLHSVSRCLDTGIMRLVASR